jgi:hypothetical protein
MFLAVGLGGGVHRGGAFYKKRAPCEKKFFLPAAYSCLPMAEPGQIKELDFRAITAHDGIVVFLLPNKHDRKALQQYIEREHPEITVRALCLPQLAHTIKQAWFKCKNCKTAENLVPLVEQVPFIASERWRCRHCYHTDDATTVGYCRSKNAVLVGRQLTKLAANSHPGFPWADRGLAFQALPSYYLVAKQSRNTFAQQSKRELQQYLTEQLIAQGATPVPPRTQEQYIEHCWEY